LVNPSTISSPERGERKGEKNEKEKAKVILMNSGKGED